MNIQRSISILTLGGNTVSIEFKELIKHSLQSVYYSIIEVDDVSDDYIVEAMVDWLQGKDIEFDGLKIA